MLDHLGSPVKDDDQLGQYIPIHYHYQMLADDVRMAGFKAALDIVVPEDGTVLELGSGTGAISFFAAQKAARVYSVERLPELVEHAKALVEQNGCQDKVEFIQADALTYLPPEPVDVVICEMLHAALLREKQLEIIQSFKTRYCEKFGDKMPVFVPFATVLSVEPVCADFSFHGFQAPVCLFESPNSPSARSRTLGEAKPYCVVDYQDDFSLAMAFKDQLDIEVNGTFNALRFTTKNLLSVAPNLGGSINWNNQNLILPLKKSVLASAGEAFQVSFDYPVGAPIRTLQNSIEVTKV